MKSVQEYLAYLKERGLRVTTLRESLIDTFLTNTAALSVQDILKDTKVKDLNPNKTSVYREVAALKEAGFVEEITTTDKSKTYKLSMQGHHHHLVCKNCKKTECIETEELEEALEKAVKEISTNRKFRIYSHDLVLTGICEACEY